jgi:hypothetical protein
VTAVSVALRDKVRVNAERRIVQEHAPVNLAHIDQAEPARSDEGDRAFEVERQPHIPRKVVHGAERQDAQWDIRAGEDRRCGANAAVSATDYDPVEAGPRASPAGGNLAFYSIGDPGAWHDGDRRVEIVRRAASRDPLPRSIDP